MRLKRLRRIASVNLHLFRELRQDRVHLLLRKNCSYFGDGMATANWSEFLNEKLFDEAFQIGWDRVKASNTGEQRFPQIKWRAHIVAWAFKQVKDLPGDMIECGTWFGTLMLTACHYNNFSDWDKRLFLADTWGPNQVTPPSSKYQIDIFSEVQQRFRKFPNVHLIRGVLPESLEKIEDSLTKISFLSLDLNDGPTERTILEMLWDKLVPGAIIYLDDYGGRAFERVRREIDEFLKDKSETLLHFPNQVSILIKK